jgi:amphi-Trp domain-containing protein
MSEEESFSYESVQDRETIVRYLTALAEGFEAGTLTFHWKDKEVVFRPDGLLTFSMEAKRKESQHKLTFKIGWTEGRARPSESGPLVIGRGGPSEDGR